MSERPYDIVRFGATGFMGALAAAYLARTAGRERFRWAPAGRSQEKLAAVLRVAMRLARKPHRRCSLPISTMPPR
ncbi:MAG: hypothetical protein ACOY9J_12610 [Pseudomonadota bacterium]